MKVLIPFLILMFSTTVSAQSSSLENRIRELERRISILEAAVTSGATGGSAVNQSWSRVQNWIRVNDAGYTGTKASIRRILGEPDGQDRGNGGSRYIYPYGAIVDFDLQGKVIGWASPDCADDGVVYTCN